MIRRIARTTVMAAIFVALAPLIAATAFVLATTHDLSGLDRPFVILSYTVGALPALAAGIAVGAAQGLRGPARALVVLIVGLAAGAVVGLFMAGMRGAGGIDGVLVALVLSCVFATFACWGIARACWRQLSPDMEAAR